MTYNDFRNIDRIVYNSMVLNPVMHKLQTIKELMEFFRIKKKFYLFPITFLLIMMIGLTALAQTGLIAFIYPI